MSVLVTGADGFIGSHLTEELVRRGHTVRAFVHYNSFGNWGWLDDAPDEIRDGLDVFAGDIRDPDAVRNAVRGCEKVLHLAALISIPYSYLSPFAYVETNVRGTLNVVQAARDLDVERVVHTSTSEVYGSAQYVPMDERHPLRGQSPYAASKIGADQIALSFHRSFGTPVAVARPFNTFGPRQSARAVIPTIITQIASGERTLKLGSVAPTRDFNYVKDTVAGLIAMMESVDVIGEEVNLGSNHEISIGETVVLIAEAMNAEVTVLTDPERVRPANSEVDRLWADNRKARELLGWSPRYAARDGFKEALVETAAWFLETANLRRFKQGLYQV